MKTKNFVPILQRNQKIFIYFVIIVCLFVFSTPIANITFGQAALITNKHLYLTILRKPSPFALTDIDGGYDIAKKNYHWAGQFINLSSSTKNDVKIHTKIYNQLTGELLEQVTQTISNVDILPGQTYPFAGISGILDFGASGYMYQPLYREIEFIAWKEITNTRSATVTATISVSGSYFDTIHITVTNQNAFALKDIYALVWALNAPASIPYTNNNYMLIASDLKPGQTITYTRNYPYIYVIGNFKDAKVLTQGTY